LPNLTVSHVVLVDDIVLVAGMSDVLPFRPHLFAFDAFDTGFRQGMYMMHNPACHEHPITALAGLLLEMREREREIEREREREREERRKREEREEKS